MSLYKRKMNPFTGTFDYVIKGNLVSFEEGVATAGDLPSTGNVEGDARIANDNHHLYIWNGSAWEDQGDIIDIKWATLEDKPTSTVENIDDAVGKKHIQNSDEYLNTQITHTIYVDKNRTDSYTQDGSITRPYKTIQGAIDLITGASVYNRFLVLIYPGEYEEQIVMKNYVNLAGLSIDTVWIKSLDGDVVTTATDADISNVLINYEGSDPSKVALRLNSGAITIIDQVTFYSIYTAIQINNGAILVSFDSGALTGESDNVIVKSGGYGSFSAFTFSGWGSPYYDLTVESGGFADIYPDCYFYNERINNLGTISLTHSSSRTKNDSSVTGTTVKDALDNIKTEAIDKAHAHSNKVELDLITDGDHDVRVDNPHIVTVDQLDLASGTVASDVDDAVSKKHSQNTDIALRTDKLTVDVNGNTAIKGDIQLDDDKYLYLDTAKTSKIGYSPNHDMILVTGDYPGLASEEGMFFYANGGVDGTGQFEPNIILTDDGAIELQAMGEDVEGENYISLKARDYIEIDTSTGYIKLGSSPEIRLQTTGGEYAVLKTGNLTAAKTFQFPNISGTLVTTAGALADINMGTHKLTNLSVPSSNGDSIRATTKITEVSLEDAIDKKHTQNTDIALRTDKLTVDTNGNTAIVGELKIKVFAQAEEPTLNADEYMAIWKDTDDANRVYLLFRRGAGDQVAVELA